MFNLDQYKLAIAASAVALSAAVFTGCMDGASKGSAAASATGSAWKTGPDIGGGVSYPINGDKTGPYYVNDTAHNMTLNHGRVPTKDELAAWDVDINAGYVYQANPNETGLPEGSGSVSEGEEIYEAKCVMCHGDFGSGAGGEAGNYPALSLGNAERMQKSLTNNRWLDPEHEGPVRFFGSYWPQANTMWWYIRDGMPHPFSKSLTDDEVYALTAYMLYINEMSINGELVDEEYVLDREKFIAIKMPNEDGFEPNIKGPNALADVRAYYANESNYAGIRLKNPSERCMKDCLEPTAKVVRVQHGGISDFNPPMSAVRDLPSEEAKAFVASEVYTKTCAMCHDGFLTVQDPMWADYTAKGMDAVYANGINGVGGMPAKGGSSLSDEEFKAVVDYIISGK
jgi:cytochrome c